MRALAVPMVYLRRMCPPHGCPALNGVEGLPCELPKVYLRLRGAQGTGRMRTPGGARG